MKDYKLPYIDYKNVNLHSRYSQFYKKKLYKQAHKTQIFDCQFHYFNSQKVT